MFTESQAEVGHEVVAMEVSTAAVTAWQDMNR